MGRRKIEIQPITHERNRSVTFQKRKNGLFKKAYELGVLCSVDVAVILFEQRPGHPPKLYQYGSSNIHEIVQRQLRHDGENDTRGPAEFTGGGAGGKNDDDDDVDEGEGDGEVDDDGEDLGPPLTKVSTRSKRRGDGQFKPMATGVLQQDMDYRISSVPSHMPLGPPQPHLPSPSHSTFGLSGSIHHHHQRQQHPISSDRLRPMDQYQDGQHQSKRPRLDVLTAPQQHHQQYNRGGSQSSLPSPVNQGRGGEYGYHPSPSQFQGPPSSHQYPPQYAFPAGGSLSSHSHPYPVSSPGPPPPFLSLNAQTPAEYSYPPPPPPGSGLPSSSPGSRPSSRRDSGSAYANTRSAGGVYGNENGNRTQIANGMYAPSPGPGSGQGGSAISNEHDGTKLLSDIFGSTSAARGSGDAANSANPASVREEDGSVGSNPNAPGVWLDFLSTPTGVGATSSTTPNDNGNVSLRNAASKLSSSSTSASQVPSPATEASASGNAVEGVSLSGLGLFEMGTGGDEDTGSRGSDKSKDRQESGGV